MRLRTLQGRTLLAQLRGDPAAIVAVLVLAAAIMVAVHRILLLELQSGVRIYWEALLLSGVFLGAFGVVARAEGDRLISGPFHVILAHKYRERAWLSLQAGMIYFTPIVLLASALLPASPGRAAGLLAASVAGAGAALLSLHALSRFGVVKAPGWVKADARGRASLKGVMLATRLQWRRRAGPVSGLVGAALLLAAGAGATGLAVRNNADPDLARGVLAVAGLASGYVMGRLDLQLLRFAAQEPIPLKRLLMDFVLASPTLTASAIFGLGWLVGVGPLASALVGVVAGAAMLLYSTLTLLHALGGVRSFPGLAASLDLGIAALLGGVFPPLAAAWILVRGVALVRAAGRLRWLDR